MNWLIRFTLAVIIFATVILVGRVVETIGGVL